MTTVEEPLSHSYASADGLARPLMVPKLPAGRGCTVTPTAYLLALCDRLRGEAPLEGPPASTHNRLWGLANDLHELGGAPLWRVDGGSRVRLLRGADALEALMPGDWRARVVVRHAHRLARRPEEVLHVLSKVHPRRVAADRAEVCVLCGEADPLTWWVNWCCTRRARRRVGSGRVCGCCVEHFEA